MGKPTEDNFNSLNIGWVKKHCMIEPGRICQRGSINFSKGGSIGYELNTMERPGWFRVQYTHVDSNQHYDYRIPFAVTYPHYGGERLWFLCPMQGCGRRVCVLYLGRVFACRHCRNITYLSQKEGREGRLSYKVQKIHQQLGGNWAMDDAPPPKPKGMHWKTYWRRVDIMNAADNTAYAMMIERFFKRP